MAVSSRVIFFLSVLVVSSMQTHARESHFFSKFPRESPQDKNPSFVTVEANKKQQENQDPSFVPQSGNGYGLYGHETSYNNKAQDHFNNDENNNKKKYEENVTYEPYTTPSLSQTEERSDNHDRYPKNSENNYKYNYDNENNKKYYNNNNEYKYNYNANAYEEDQKEPQRFANRGYNTYNKNNNNNNMPERQGMSDTRFMEQGKYYYDVINEKNHGQYYAKHGRYGQNNLNEGGRFYDNNENSFRDPYDSRWEKNMMNNNEQQEFGEEQQDQFMP